MKAILSRLFNHEELTRKEAKNLLLNITRGMYNDAQIAALLTVFQMRGIKVEELIGFREALLTTRIPIDFSAYTPIDIVGTGGDGKKHLQYLYLRLLHCSRSRISCCQTRQLWRDFRQRSQQCHRTTRCKIHEQSG